MGLVEAGIWPPSGRTAQYEPTHNAYYVKLRITGGDLLCRLHLKSGDSDLKTGSPEIRPLRIDSPLLLKVVPLIVLSV